MRTHSPQHISEIPGHSGSFPSQGVSSWTAASVHYLEKALITLSSCSRSIQFFLSGSAGTHDPRNTFPTSVRDLKTGRIIDIRLLNEQNKNNLWT